jgi:hypothetical protein
MQGRYCLVTPQAYTFDLRVGIETVLEIIGHFLFTRERLWYHLTLYGHDQPTYHQMLLDTRNKNIYGLGVGILTVFEIFGHFL